ncbi:MAG: hypothetical protein JWO15_3155, partial [Sphingomonadales bacterium]|nr:hypothetical protein [Sphingomonadales bacterium]
MSDPRIPWRFVAAALLALSSLSTVSAAAQTRVENVATFNFRTAAGAQTIASNRTTLDVAARIKRPTTLDFRQIPLGYQFKDVGCRDGSPYPVAIPSEVTADEAAASTKLEALTIDMPLIIVLHDEAGNHDPNVRETAWIYASTDTHTNIVLLTETAPDSGVFAGAFPPASTAINSPCDFSLKKSQTLSVRFME